MPSTLSHLRTLVRPYRWRYVVGLSCIVASLWLKLQIPEYFWGSLGELLQLERGEAELDQDQASGLIINAALLIFGSALLIAPIRTASRLLILGTSRKISRDLLGQIFARMLKLAPSFYSRNPTGQLMSRAINDREYVRSLYGAVLMYIVETITLYAIAIPRMFEKDPELALWALAPYPVFLVFARFIAVRIQTTARASQNALASITEKTDESLSGQLVIKTLTLEDADFAKFTVRCEEFRGLNLRLAKLRALMISSMMALAGLSTMMVLYIGGTQVAEGAMAFEDFGVLITYLAWLAVPTRTLGFVISSLKRGTAAHTRVLEVIESAIDLRQEMQTTPSPDVTSAALRVENLSVVYPPFSEQPHLEGSLPPEHIGSHADVERTVLDNIQLTVPPGTTLGIVGHTGSGKTTLARVLARQLEVPPGTVFVDDQDITSFPLEDLREHVGYVPQDAFLFSESLRDNVSLANPDVKDEEVLNALAGAQLDKDLDQLPDGLDTIIGERGVNLSGGQRQRTALARVLLFDPKLLILDDTLSAVDTNTAESILEYLRPFAAGRTTILIAHRLSSLSHAEQIIVLDDGKIVERGTHDELLDLGGRYAGTWKLQQESEDNAVRASQLEQELEEGFESESDQ
jgi:ATP-binding cassette, subfamily B, multidrug efflux pump